MCVCVCTYVCTCVYLPITHSAPSRLLALLSPFLPLILAFLSCSFSLFLTLARSLSHSMARSSCLCRSLSLPTNQPPFPSFALALAISRTLFHAQAFSGSLSRCRFLSLARPFSLPNYLSIYLYTGFRAVLLFQSISLALALSRSFSFSLSLNLGGTQHHDGFDHSTGEFCEIRVTIFGVLSYCWFLLN